MFEVKVGYKISAALLRQDYYPPSTEARSKRRPDLKQLSIQVMPNKSARISANAITEKHVLIKNTRLNCFKGKKEAKWDVR